MKDRKFRKRPVVIEAVQVTDENLVELLRMAEEHPDVSTLCQTVDGGPVTNRVHSVEIRTLEGVMTADRGDWIITGVAGEVYPCKPAIFDQCYEAVIDGE